MVLFPVGDADAGTDAVDRVAALSSDYLDIEKQLFGLALLTLVLFFNFHAPKFNVNTMLMPLWAATTPWFMRSQPTRSALYGALAGCGAAAHMLGKYWSIFLIAGLVLATHLVLLYQEDFAPFSYAVGIHGAKPTTETVIAALGYLAGSIGYAAGPCRARRHGVARRGQALAGGGVPGAVAAVGGRRAVERQRHHLAVVNVGLDTVAGAAVVAERDDDISCGHALPARFCGGADAGHGDRLASEIVHLALTLIAGLNTGSGRS